MPKTLEEILCEEPIIKRAIHRTEIYFAEHPLLTFTLAAVPGYFVAKRFGVEMYGWEDIWRFSPWQPGIGFFFGAFSTLMAKAAKRRIYEAGNPPKIGNSLADRIGYTMWRHPSLPGAIFFMLVIAKVSGSIIQVIKEPWIYTLTPAQALWNYLPFLYVSACIGNTVGYLLHPVIRPHLSQTISTLLAEVKYMLFRDKAILEAKEAELEREKQTQGRLAEDYAMLMGLKRWLGKTEEFFQVTAELYSESDQILKGKNIISTGGYIAAPGIELQFAVGNLRSFISSKFFGGAREDYYLRKAISVMLTYNNVRRAKRLMAKAVTVSNHRPDVQALYSLFLHYFKQPEAEREMHKMVELVLSDNKLRVEPLGESVNKVYTIGPSKFLESTLIFKEHPELEVLEQEYTMREHLEAAIQGLEGYALPEVLAPPATYIVNGEEMHVYVLKRSPGVVLWDLMQEDETPELVQILNRIAEVIAVWHASLPTDLSELGALKLDAKLRSRLNNEHLRAHLLRAMQPSDYESLVRTIEKHYTPVYNTFEESVWALNLDSHPQQYILGRKGTITRVDTEDKGVVPVQFDLVNLMECVPVLSEDEKLAAIELYHTVYMANATPNVQALPSLDELALHYYNGIIQRAISLCAAWSSPDRTRMWQYRPVILGCAINAIEQIKHLNHGYYFAHSTHYKALRDGLLKIQECLVGLSA